MDFKENIDEINPKHVFMKNDDCKNIIKMSFWPDTLSTVHRTKLLKIDISKKICCYYPPMDYFTPVDGG